MGGASWIYFLFSPMLNYFNFGRIWLTGGAVCTGYRPIMEAFSTFCPTTTNQAKIFKEDVEDYEEVKTFELASCQQYKDDKPIADRILNEMKYS